jgi:cbb3-type cytochrome oxidase cytochrome c subunit
VSEGYILPKGDDLAEAEVRRLVDIAKVGQQRVQGIWLSDHLLVPRLLLPQSGDPI